jgi:hypothetical protein
MTGNDDRYYNREILYDEIWKEPMTVVCKRYGVPNTALIKACGELNIPRPYAGYWTQKECGKAPPQPELPEFDNPPRLLIHPPGPQPPLSNRRIDENLNRAVKAKPEKAELEKAEPKPEPCQDTQSTKAVPADLVNETNLPVKTPA